MKRSFQKKNQLLFGIKLFIIAVLLSGAFLPAEATLHSFAKKEDAKVEPNVLILLDTSGSMTWKMGVKATNENAPNFCTFGDGSKPSGGQKYFGRDLVSSNNDMSNAYNYHPNLRYILETDLTGISNAEKNMYLSKWVAEETPAPDTAAGESIYKYPNDSRMYILKNVMQNILNSKAHIAGLRVALATYEQEKKNSLTASDWYYWIPSQNPYYRQDIYWKGGGTRGQLREPFKATSDPDHLANLKKWFDGEEDADRRELRADGAIPLAVSIYSTAKNAQSAKQFFETTGVITDYCQDNWLIVLTDGEDSEGGNPVKAVEDLYNLKDGKKARKIKTFVIGLIDPKEQSTLKQTLDNMAVKGQTKRAYFPQNMEELLLALREIFLTIQEQAGSGTAPLATPSRSAAGEDSFYQASYFPRSGKQWEGYMHKFTYDGTTYEQAWEAASNLSGMTASERLIFTTADTLNNKEEFLDNNSTLISIMGLTSENGTSEAGGKDFINWVRGSAIEGYKEDYKLFDIFHSGFVKVGQPDARISEPLYRDFITRNNDRDTMIYVQSNAGMVHGFYDEGDNGGNERFAFIPPNVLESGRMRGMKWDDAYGKTGRFENNPFTYPRYLADGPLLAEDVVIGEGNDRQYRTVLLGLLGLGGSGMYALDVTYPDNPGFLWAVENSIYQPTEEKILSKGSAVLFWNPASGTSSPEILTSTTLSSFSHDDSFGKPDNPKNVEFDYRSLRFTTSTPFIGYLPTGEWAFVMGNGSPRGFDSPEGVLYIGDISNGKIIKKIQTSTNQPLISPVAVLNEGKPRLIRTIFIGDASGDIFKIRYDDDTQDWSKTNPFSVGPNVGFSYSLDATIFDGKTWLFAGTGDVENYLGKTGNPGGQSNYDIFVAVNIDHENPAKKQTDLSPNPLNVSDPLSLASGDKGWWVRFGADERMSTPPVIYNGYVYFSTFSPGDDPCVAGGESRLYAMNGESGKGAWSGDSKFVSFTNIAITGISLYKGNIALGVTKFANSAFPSGVDFTQLGENILITLAPPGGNGGGPGSKIMKTYYWKSR